MIASHFSIIIPTWNNLPYLKLCIESLGKNSFHLHQIIVHVNEGTDATLEWVKSKGIEYTFSNENIGVCRAVNTAAALAKNNFIVFMNDDMYACKDWDKYLTDEIEKMDTDIFMLSSTMIEPSDSGNPCVIVNDFGNTVETFREQDLNHSEVKKNDWQGASWTPVLIPVKIWKEVGGLSEEFSPGMYSDPDLSMKLWQKGCRVFKGMGESHVYHFQCKTTGRIKKNDGRKQFLKKWGILPSVFYKYYLRMGKPYDGILKEPEKTLGFKISMWKSKLLNHLTS